MATNGKYTFVKDLPEDFTCPVCLDAIYDAKQTDCCGHHLCKACTDRLVASTGACPQCGTSPLATHDDLFMRRKLEQLHIYCTNRQARSKVSYHYYPTKPGEVDVATICNPIKGCEWSGEINNLQEHLDKQCPHGPVTCQYRCGTKLLRCQKEPHETRQCVKRPFKCWYCGMKATAIKIDRHGPTCDRRPTKCPNKCPASLVLGQVQDHLKQCPLQEVSCEFEHAGCSKKVLYKDYDSHLKEDSLSHQRLLSTALAAQAKQAEELKQSVMELKTRMNILSEMLVEKNLI